MTGTYTRGVVFVHSTPPALCPHLEWSLSKVLDCEIHLEWVEQPAQPRTFRTEYAWVGPVGTGAKLASALRGWEHLRYEITEEPVRGSNGARWCHTPSLGIFHAPMDVCGNQVVLEDQIRAALETATSLTELKAALELAMGQPWDDELETFRKARDGVAVRWLHQVS